MTADLLEALNVSRETFERLEAYRALVEKWTKKINLVSRRDSSDIWNRHILDSVQLYEATPKSGPWVDLGSGGGFPGVVVAILDRQFLPERTVTLVDSDQRKCAFLRTAARELELNTSVRSERLEDLEPQGASVLSARALGPLSNLLEASERHLNANGIAIFPKGKTWKQEHEEAQKTWSYEIEALKSKTNPDAVILKIKDIARV